MIFKTVSPTAIIIFRNILWIEYANFYPASACNASGRDIVLAIPSVRPSVRPMPILCLNEGTYRHTSDDGRGIILVTKFEGEPPQRGSLNTRGGKNAIIALYLRNDTR